jgi:hypothetical protein
MDDGTLQQVIYYRLQYLVAMMKSDLLFGQIFLRRRSGRNAMRPVVQFQVSLFLPAFILFSSL